jgi:hypothetical protein
MTIRAGEVVWNPNGMGLEHWVQTPALPAY